MITIFTIPKDYSPAASIAQHNAVGSWLAAASQAGWKTPPQIILVGTANGTGEHAKAAGVEHFPDVETNTCGTPLLSHAFAEATRRTRFPVVCYLNADIILTPEFASAIARLLAVAPKEGWLAVARRRTIDVTTMLSFDDPAWPDRFSTDAYDTLDSPGSIDCFLFPASSMSKKMPPFAVGRPTWDNWMIYDAWSRGLPVIDLTPAAHLVHQKHDYSHLGAARDYDDAVDADHNRRLLGNPFRVFTIADASHMLTRDGTLTRHASPPLVRRVRKIMALHPALIWLMRVVAFPILAVDIIRTKLRTVGP